MNNKKFYLGFLGFLGFYGFVEQAYFLFFLFFLFFLAGAKKKDVPDLIDRQAKEKEEHKQKILDFIAGKEKITNNDIQNFLGVSDATAERYLNELEKEGVLNQSGKSGKYVFYSKV